MKSKRLKNVKKQLPRDSDMTESERWYLNTFVQTHNRFMIFLKYFMFIFSGSVLVSMYFIVTEERHHPQLLLILTMLFGVEVMLIVMARKLPMLSEQTDFFEKKQLISGRFQVKSVRRGGHSYHEYYVDDRKIIFPDMFYDTYHLHHKQVSGYVAETLGINLEGKNIRKINLLLLLDNVLNIDDSFSNPKNRKAYLFYKYGRFPMLLLLAVLIGIYAVCAEVMLEHIPLFVYILMFIAYVALSLFLVYRLYNWLGAHYFSRTYEDIFPPTSEKERFRYGRKSKRKINKPRS